MQTFSGNRWMRLIAAGSVAASMGLAAAGCLGLDVAGTFRWPGPKVEQVTASHMTVSWKNDIQKKSGKNMLRGFEGKVQFFAADPPRPADKEKEAAKAPETKPKSVAVDGTLTVYAFEESADGKEGAGPSKKYVFPTKELRRVHREGPDGHEYNIWMAWDKAGGNERHIRLLARFDPTGGGQVVMSDNSRETLPGFKVEYASGQAPKMRKRPPGDSSGQPITQADFEKQADATSDSKSPAKAAAAPLLDETR